MASGLHPRPLSGVALSINAPTSRPQFPLQYNGAKTSLLGFCENEVKTHINMLVYASLRACMGGLMDGQTDGPTWHFLPLPLLSGATVATKGLREKTQVPLSSGEPADAPIQSPLCRPGAGAPQPLRLAERVQPLSRRTQTHARPSVCSVLSAEGGEEAWAAPPLTPPLSHISRLTDTRPWLLTDTY